MSGRNRRHISQRRAKTGAARQTRDRLDQTRRGWHSRKKCVASSAQTFPNAVAQHKSRVEHIDDGFISRDQCSVQIKQDRGIPVIRHIGMGSETHSGLFSPEGTPGRLDHIGFFHKALKLRHVGKRVSSNNRL